jgi:dynein heavy chain 1
LQARLAVFYEEELLVPLVVFDSVLENAVRIERVLNQPIGHMLLVGESGAGKTVLSRFVAWMEGLSVFQVPSAARVLCAFDRVCSRHGVHDCSPTAR